MYEHEQYRERYIYGMFDCFDKTVYIGETCRPEERFYQHLNNSINQSNDVQKYFYSIRSKGYMPSMIILETLPRAKHNQAVKFELAWTFIAARDGFKIVTSNRDQWLRARGIATIQDIEISKSRKMPVLYYNNVNKKSMVKEKNAFDCLDEINIMTATDEEIENAVANLSPEHERNKKLNFGDDL